MSGEGITKFWLVWSDDGRAPTRKHWTKASAETEADRLATSHPGQVFTILACVGARLAHIQPAAKVAVVKREPRKSDDEIPF